MAKDFLIRNIADSEMAAIKHEAKRQHRSINEQLNVIIESWFELKQKGVIR